MSGDTSPPGGSAELLPVGAFQRYLQTTCVPLLTEEPASSAIPAAFATDLAASAAIAILEQFVADPVVRVLQVHCLMVKSDEQNGGDLAAAQAAFKIRLNLGIEYVPGTKVGHDVVCFIKRSSAPLAADQPFNSQLQVMTLGLGKNAAEVREGSATSSGENTEEEDDERDNLFSVVYNYVHQSFGPLVHEYSKAHQPQYELTTASEGTRGSYISLVECLGRCLWQFSSLR